MDIYKELTRPKKSKQDVNLEGPDVIYDSEFQLQSEPVNKVKEAQAVFRLPPKNIEQAEFQPQLEFDGMSKPSFKITFEKCLINSFL